MKKLIFRSVLILPIMATLLANCGKVETQTETGANTGTEVETQVDLEDLEVGDTVRILYVSFGCFHGLGCDLEISATSSGLMLSGKALLLDFEDSKAKFKDDTSQKLGTILLSGDDVKRLTASIRFLRTPNESSCTTVDEIVLTRERSGKVTAREKLTDQTCALGRDPSRLSFRSLIAKIQPTEE